MTEWPTLTVAELISGVTAWMQLSMAGAVAARLRRDKLSARKPNPDGWVRFPHLKEQTAFHESGHVIAGVLLGFGVPTRVSTVTSGESSGATFWGSDIDASSVPSDGKRNARLLRVLYEAGEGRSWREMLGLVRRIRDETRGLLDQHWDALELLAWRLLTVHELTGNEVGDLLRWCIPSIPRTDEHAPRGNEPKSGARG